MALPYYVRLLTDFPVEVLAFRIDRCLRLGGLCYLDLRYLDLGAGGLGWRLDVEIDFQYALGVSGEFRYS